MEIDEYQNYEKAAGALNEAYNCLQNNADSDTMKKLPTVQYKLEKVKQFLDIKR